MAFVDVEYPADLQLASSIFQVAAAVHSIVLFTYHIGHIIPIRDKTTRRRGKKRRPSPVEILSLVVLFFFVLFQCWEATITIQWNPLPNISLRWCSLIKRFSSILYITTKALLYILLLERLYVAFDRSDLAFSASIKWGVRMFIVLWLLTFGTLHILFVDGEYDDVTGVCFIILPSYLAGVGLLSDIVIVTAISITFCRRLLLVNRRMAISDALPVMELSSTATSTKSGTDEKELPPERPRTMSQDSVSTECFTYDLIRKTLVLTLVALLTTPASLIIAATIGLVGFWVAVDFIISSWTVILLFAKHNWIYDHLCKHLEVMVTIKCLSIYSCYICEDYCCCCTHQLEEATSPESPPTSTPGTAISPAESPPQIVYEGNVV